MNNCKKQQQQKKETDEDLKQAKVNIEKLEKENQQLHAYIEKLGQD